ncbi:Crp/Fnr family transcriptional regulator [Xanthobacter sp. V4C-4]|uniref:Crp/Fnr family transcriptional regulator n=1 Tax=Xanthobacter cornucopiae TaxID=3119924 RepID=UPI003729F9B2
MELEPVDGRTVRGGRRRRAPEAGPSAAILPGERALFLSESVDGLDEGAHFLDRLTAPERERLRGVGRPVLLAAGEAVFAQGEPHSGIFIIEEGRVRVFYTAPSGREITLAYWTPGHFCGGPEMAGGGAHIWSGVALEPCRLTLIPSAALHALVTQVPNFALCLIEGLVAKGKSYSAMAQMLGTRSVIERLAQFLLNLGDLHGVREGRAIVIHRRITHDQIAAMVGSTRQWVTMMLKRFQKKGVVSVTPGAIRIDRPDLLLDLVSKDG